MAINAFPIATTPAAANLVSFSPTAGISSTDVQSAIAEVKSSIPSPGPGTDPLALIHGLSVNATNPTIGNDPNLRRAVDINVTTDSSTSNSGFTDENALDVNLLATHGQNTAAAKRTFIPLNVSGTYYGAGQKFISTTTLVSYSMGDTATWGNNYVQFAGGPISGDEGVGWGLVSSLTQQPDLTLATINGIPTPATLSTTLTQSVTGSKDSQTVTVASSVGASVGNWLVIDQEVATGSPKMEAVQLTAVGPGTITAVFQNSHVNGTTVKPALLLQINNSFSFGEERYLINKSVTPVTAGTVSSISGGGFTGTGTAWSTSMVGGNALNIGMISLAADDVTGGGHWDPGTNRLRSWYSITSVGDATHLGIHTFSVAGDAAYRGKGPGSGAYTIRPSAKLLRNLGGGAMVFENSTSTWTLNDSVELVICPYPDVSGFQYHMASYTNGGTYRGFLSVDNNGARTFGAAFACAGVAGSIGTPNGDPVGWDTGILLDSVNTGVLINQPQVQGIGFSGSINNAMNITWTQDGRSLGPDTTNFGMQWQTTSVGPPGVISFAAPSTPSNSDANSPAITWAGKLRLTPAVPTVAAALEVYNTTDLNTNFTKGAFNIQSSTICFDSESGGTLASTPMPIRFLINGTEKIKIGTPSNGQDVVIFSTLASQLNPITFASKPSSSVKGMVAVFTDSTTATWGATVAGGGANNVLAWFNGSNWTVIGA